MTFAPLRILHTENSQAWGGQEVRILTEAHGLLARGHHVKLLVCPGSPIGAEAARMGIPTEMLDIASKGLRPLLALRRWMRRHGSDYDVVNTHSSTDSWLAAVARGGLSRMPPIVRTRHVSTPVNRHWTTRWLYLRATAHVVTTGEALRQQLHRDNAIPLAHMTSVRTGIDLGRYAPRSRHAAREALGVRHVPTLGIVATLRSWKGHDDLLDAFARLRTRFPDWQLLIIGDGPQRARLEAHARMRALGDAVRFTGQTGDVPAWLATLDLFVLPSSGDEGVPQSIMQAMACGLPVVSTSVGAIQEAVQHERTGLVIAPRDPQALDNALATLMGDAGRRERFGAAGLAYAREHFAIRAMLDEMETIFRRFCRPSHRA
jgi:glycosyltransferase involved in cell wall biosynthesis